MRYLVDYDDPILRQIDLDSAERRERSADLRARQQRARDQQSRSSAEIAELRDICLQNQRLIVALGATIEQHLQRAAI